MIVDSLGGLFSGFEWLFEGETEKVGFEIELEDLFIDIELTGGDLDVGEPNADYNVVVILGDFELWDKH